MVFERISKIGNKIETSFFRKKGNNIWYLDMRSQTNTQVDIPSFLAFYLSMITK